MMTFGRASMERELSDVMSMNCAKERRILRVSRPILGKPGMNS